MFTAADRSIAFYTRRVDAPIEASMLCWALGALLLVLAVIMAGGPS